MRILVACEESQRVCIEFRKLGHQAFSCDLLPCSGGHPDWHIQGDVREVINREWDMIIAFPTCTYLTCSAEWAYKDPDFDRYPDVGYHQRIKKGTLFGEDRRKARVEAIEFFNLFWNAPVDKIAIENPVGVLSKAVCKPSQTIQPYEFGDDASKRTCLWLKGLPILESTEYVEPRMVNGKPRWANQTDSGQNRLSPSEDRAKERSKTYPGIAKAMADQWG